MAEVPAFWDAQTLDHLETHIRARDVFGLTQLMHVRALWAIQASITPLGMGSIPEGQIPLQTRQALEGAMYRLYHGLFLEATRLDAVKDLVCAMRDLTGHALSNLDPAQVSAAVILAPSDPITAPAMPPPPAVHEVIVAPKVPTIPAMLIAPTATVPVPEDTRTSNDSPVRTSGLLGQVAIASSSNPPSPPGEDEAGPGSDEGLGQEDEGPDDIDQIQSLKTKKTRPLKEDTHDRPDSGSLIHPLPSNLFEANLLSREEEISCADDIGRWLQGIVRTEFQNYQKSLAPDLMPLSPFTLNILRSYHARFCGTSATDLSGEEDDENDDFDQENHDDLESFELDDDSSGTGGESFKMWLKDLQEGDLPPKGSDSDMRIGEQSRDRMVLANTRLVSKIASDFSHFGLSHDDLFQEGIKGLMTAAQRFNHKKGKLSAYATWWIKQCIKRALANQLKTIRVPEYIIRMIINMRQIAVKMQEGLGREPTDTELRTRLGLKPQKFLELKQASMSPVSLDAPLSDDRGRSTLGEMYPDDRVADASDNTSGRDLIRILPSLLFALDERERRIIEARFGLNGQDKRTLEEVALEYGVTRERIRQLQNIALRKLRRALHKKEDPIPKALRTQELKKQVPAVPIPDSVDSNNSSTSDKSEFLRQRRAKVAAQKKTNNGS